MTAAAWSRVRFEHGQRLDARDLDDAVTAESAAGSHHIVGAHDTWGIALGLEVSLYGRAITVARGVAYDAWGRTLVVPAPVRLEAPRADAVIVVRWDAGTAAVRALAPADVHAGRDVPLAALTFAERALDAGVRRYARSRSVPRVACGSLTTNLTFTPGQEVRVVAIDTSRAHFVGVPSYTVSMVGDVDLPSRLGPLVSIFDPLPNGFKIRVRYARRVGDLQVERSVELQLLWLGVEPRKGCALPSSNFETRPA